MKVVVYSMMIKNVDGSIFAIINKNVEECVNIINQHIKDEYNVDMKLTYTKLYDIIRGKTKNTFYNNIIETITSKQLNRLELNELRQKQNIIIYNDIKYDLENKEDFLNYGKIKGYL